MNLREIGGSFFVGLIPRVVLSPILAAPAVALRDGGDAAALRSRALMLAVRSVGSRAAGI